MAQLALSGNDTLSINGTLITDLSTGDCVDLTYPNKIMVVKTGKNGNSIYGVNESGRQCQVKMRVIRGGASDKFLNQLLQNQIANPAGTALMIATFVKKVGDGLGNITNDTYILSGGVFDMQVEGKMNVEGNTDQSESIYEMMFTLAPRALT